MLLANLIKITIKMNIMKAEFWMLQCLDRLYRIYPEIEQGFLGLYNTLKERGLNPDNIEWFVNAMETDVIKLPELQNQ